MRITKSQFLTLIEAAKSSGAGEIYPPDDEQAGAVYADANCDLFVVAGPGTGKTSCVSYRALYLVLVCGYPPGSILATTFTKKAASELRSRLLGWGYRMIDAATAAGFDTETISALSALDLNQIATGTLDSIAERVLREHRGPGDEPPVLADEYVASTELLRSGLLNSGRFRSRSLADVLLAFKGGSTWGFNIQQKATLLRAIADRRHNDLVDMQKFMRIAPKRQRKGRKRILEALQDYDTEIQSKGTLDFAQLERRFADGLAAGAYKGFADQLKAILVDEYQDTNALQESIYLSLAKASGASLTVVGDDDQSLYRFRGATVELFKDYPKRLQKNLGRSAKLVFLTRNYRSTEQIVKFVGDYAELDRKFQEVRVRNKPRITTCRPGTSTLPVAAMFRDDTKSLARDLAKFLHSMFRSRGVLVGGEFIECGAGGDAGDVALLCYSPMEDGEKRLPSLLRNELSSLNPPIDLFNPRGEELSKIPLMQEFGGLVLNCLDPSDQIAPLLRSISKDAKETLASWRIAAERRLNGKSSTGLRRYVEAWSKRTNGKATEVPAIDLVYDLRRWFPEFQQDSEQQVYFEGFTRQLQAAEKLGSFSGRIIRDPKNPELSKKSREHLIRDFLGPIATGIVGVNEELITAFPHNRISVLSIHQSKGLEFPVVVVDVGSRFKNDSYVQRRFRFPEEGDVPHRLENAMRPASRALGQPNRDVIDRAFDDLYRLYYVAFSRARDLLLLVGLNKQIPNIARGWTRNKRDRWSSNQPYVEI